MRIACSCAWTTGVRRWCLDGEEIVLSYNDTEFKDPDAVLDLSVPFNPLSFAVAAAKRAYASTEPAGTAPVPERHQTQEFNDYYKLAILSWHSRFRDLPQFLPFSPSCLWASPEWDPNRKKFELSGVFSGKADPNMPGYCLRHKILEHEAEVAIPSCIWNYRKQWQGQAHEYPLPKKDPAMGGMFHLAIENCQQPGYFTEKLIDCFATCSVPLYFGDPDIAQTFNKAGIITLDPDNWLQQVNALTPELYQSMIPAVQDNFQRSLRFWSMELRFIRLLMGARQ